MTVSGFTIVRNGILYGYPFKEAILSVLPLCDEFIAGVGDSSDETLDVIRSIDDKKVRVVRSKWDMSLKNGKVLSTETNKVLGQCKGDWCFYIQADEVLHEKYYDVVKQDMTKYLKNDKVEGLRFKYRHFYGSYDYYQDNYRNWYIKEVRIIKNRENIISWGDAMDFRHPDGSKIHSKDIDAEIYHYGWVRPPETLIKKRIDFEHLYTSGETAKKNTAGFQNYDDLGNLKKFQDKHPDVMTARVRESKWNFDPQLEKQKPDWLRTILIFIQPLTKRFRRKKS